MFPRRTYSLRFAPFLSSVRRSKLHVVIICLRTYPAFRLTISTSRTLFHWNRSIKSDSRFVFRSKYFQHCFSAFYFSMSFLLLALSTSLCQLSPVPYMQSAFCRSFFLNRVFVSCKVDFSPQSPYFVLAPRESLAFTAGTLNPLQFLRSPHTINLLPFLA